MTNQFLPAFFIILAADFLQENLAVPVLNKILKAISDVFSNMMFGEKCMGELGCFNNGPPFFDFIRRTMSLLPHDREVIATTFELYTPANANNPIKFNNTNITASELRASSFDPSQKTIFIVSGFNGYGHPWTVPMAHALLAAENYNVFVVDWSGGNGPWYEKAVANSRVVGAEIAYFVQHLQNFTGISPQNIHIIGKSLGAHIAGYAGKRINKLGRITGLDPAGVYFENVDPRVRLNATDALFVDVIHTNSANNVFSGFGTTESIGHFDFYPNGGLLQTGCVNVGSAVMNFLSRLTDIGKDMEALTCNHHRAVEIMMSSITHHSCELEGVMCTSYEEFNKGYCGNCGQTSNGTCVAVGLYADRFKHLAGNSPINLYFNTTSTAPYCE